MIKYIGLRKSYLQILFCLPHRDLLVQYACFIPWMKFSLYLFPVLLVLRVMRRMRFQGFWKVQHFETLGYVWNLVSGYYTSQKMKFSIKDFFSKYDQICRKLRIRSHLLKKSSMENFIFCAVLTSKVYLESWQTSVMELFCETS